MFWLILTSAVIQHHRRSAGAVNTAADVFGAVDDGGKLMPRRLPQLLASVSDSCRPAPWALQMVIPSLFHKWRPKVLKLEIRPQ